MSKQDFKNFIRNNPNLYKYIDNGEMTWQKFYELYDIYGENNTIWDKYKDKNKNTNTVGDTSIKDLFNIIKKIDLESVKKGVDGLQKAITLFQDFSKPNISNNYQKRPLYQHFDD